MKDKKLTEKEINLEIENIKTSFAMEGMNLTEDNVDRCRRVLSEDVTLEEALGEVFVKGV